MTPNPIAFMSTSRTEFGDVAAATDFPLRSIESKDSSVTETWWYNFHVPERRLNGEIYFWIHSNLGMMSGGVWIFEGIKQHHLAAEHFGWKSFVPAPQVIGDTMSSREIGIDIRIIEPMQRHEIIYSDAESGTRLHLTADALMPPVLRSNNAHLEQPMHMRGTLTLRGEEIAIDCKSMRDRSWGKPRPEVSVIHPPSCWCVGVSDDGRTAFNFSGCDDPARAPDIAAYGMAEDSLFKDGWIMRDGYLRKFVSMSKLTKRRPGSLQAESVDCHLVDSEGDQYHVHGEILASVIWSPWPKMTSAFGQLTRWNLDGTILHGECQEVFWNDCVRRILGEADRG